ncbi:collagen alpha-1(I) chain-like [Bos mutus]|uniref:collagen alpha-1(I) chain-like n=1 Tax=Bos mutus TaxID=72004 RepID=UPI0038B5A443
MEDIYLPLTEILKGSEGLRTVSTQDSKALKPFCPRLRKQEAALRPGLQHQVPHHPSVHTHAPLLLLCAQHWRYRHWRSKSINKTPASFVAYTQVSIINLRIRGPSAPSKGYAARVSSPPTSSGRALTRTTSEQAEGPGSASTQPGGPRGGNPAPRPSPAPRPAAGGSPVSPVTRGIVLAEDRGRCSHTGGDREEGRGRSWGKRMRRKRRRRKTPSSPALGRPGKRSGAFSRPPGPGSREASPRHPQPSATFPPLAPASPPGPRPVGRLPARPPFPPRPDPGRAAGRPRAAAPPPKMAGPSLRPTGLGAGPGYRPQGGKPGRRAPGGAAAGHSPGRWRGARAVPSGESLPPASRRRRRCAPAAASAASAAPAASLSAPGAPGSAASEPQPPQVSLPGSRVRTAPGGAGVCVEAGEAAAPLPGKYRSPRTPSPAARRGPRGPARPGAEGGGGGEAGRPVAAASSGGFFFPEVDFVNLTKWRALQSCAARSAGARAAAAAAAAPQPGEPEPPAPESPHGQTDTHSHSHTHTRARTLAHAPLHTHTHTHTHSHTHTGPARSPAAAAAAAAAAPTAAAGTAAQAAAAAAAAPAPPARGVRSPEPDLGRDQQQRRQQSPRIPLPLSPPPPPPHSNGAFYYYSGGKRKGLKKNPTNKMATDRPGHVKDKFGARYACQRRARDSLGGGNGGETAGLRGGKGKRKAGRAGTEAAARPVRERPPLSGPPGRAPPRAPRPRRLRSRERAGACPACAPPALPRRARAAPPAPGWGRGRGGPGSPPAPRVPGAGAAHLHPRGASRRPRLPAGSGCARMDSRAPLAGKDAHGGCGGGGGGGGWGRGRLRASDISGIPDASPRFRDAPAADALLKPWRSIFAAAAPAFRNDGRSHHKHSRLSHGFQTHPSPPIPFRAQPSFPIGMPRKLICSKRSLGQFLKFRFLSLSKA